jgi:hypothetical protein
MFNEVEDDARAWMEAVWKAMSNNNKVVTQVVTRLWAV